MSINSGQDKAGRNIRDTMPLAVYWEGFLQTNYHVIDINMNLGLTDDTATLEYRNYDFNSIKNRAGSRTAKCGAIMTINAICAHGQKTIFKGKISAISRSFSGESEAITYELTGLKADLAKVKICGAHVVVPGTDDDDNVETKFIPTALPVFGEEYITGRWDNYQRTQNGHAVGETEDTGDEVHAFRLEEATNDDGRVLTRKPTAWDIIKYIFKWYDSSREQGVEDDISLVVDGWNAVDDAYNFETDAKDATAKDYNAYGAGFSEVFNYAVNLTGGYSWYYDYNENQLKICNTSKYNISSEGDNGTTGASKYKLSTRSGITVRGGARDTAYSETQPQILSCSITEPLNDIQRLRVLGAPKMFESTFWSFGNGVLTKAWTDEEAAAWKANKSKVENKKVYRAFKLNFSNEGEDEENAQSMLGYLMSPTGQKLAVRAGARKILPELLTVDGDNIPRDTIFWYEGGSSATTLQYVALGKLVSAREDNNDFIVIYETDEANRYPIYNKSGDTNDDIAITCAFESEYHLEAVAYIKEDDDEETDTITFYVQADFEKVGDNNVAGYYEISEGGEMSARDHYGNTTDITPQIAIQGDNDFFYGRRQNAVTEGSTFSVSGDDFYPQSGDSGTTLASYFKDDTSPYGSDIIDDRAELKKYAARKFIEAKSTFNGGSITTDDFAPDLRVGMYLEKVTRGNVEIPVNSIITTVSYDIQNRTTQLEFGAP